MPRKTLNTTLNANHTMQFIQSNNIGKLDYFSATWVFRVWRKILTKCTWHLMAGLFCGALIKVLEECSSVFQSSVIYFDHVQFWVIYSKSKSRFLSWVIGFARDNCSDCISALSSGHKPQARGEAPDNAISCYTYGINDASWLWMNLGGQIWMRRCHVCAGSLFHACKP